MALVVKDRVRVITTTTGTSDFSLGSAVTGYQSFSVIGNNNTTYYVAVDPSTGDWEVGVGTFLSAGPTLTRDTILESSNAGSKVVFVAGAKDVFVSYPAERAVYLNAAGLAVDVLDIGTLGTSTANISNANITAGTVATTPTSATDIANKTYVDTIASSGITYHTPVKYEVPNTTGNLNATYNNGVAGVGATLTNAGTKAAFAPDGPTAQVGDRILVYNQTNAFENGIYEVTTVGTPDPGGTNWVLTRTSDANSYGVKDPNKLGNGDAFFITSGNTGAGETYVCNTVGTITFGTTAITFVQVSDATLYTAGTGLTLSGTQFSITPVGTAGTYGSASQVPVIVTNASGQVSSVTNTAIAISAGAVSGLAASATTDTTNANNITSGTLPIARLSGSYTGISGVGTLTAGTWNASTIGAAYGGTGFASYAVGDLLYADTTTSLAKLADVVVGNALISGGVGTAPSWGKIGLTTHVSGTLGVANGGTGAATLTGYVYGNGTGAFTASTSIPNNATTATSANTASAIVARNASGNFSAGTITAALSGNASTATSATTATNLAGGSVGTIPYQSAAATTAMLAVGTSGQYLKSNGAAAPSWDNLPAVNNGTLTMVTSGTGLSGSATFTANQSGNSTFTVSSNATNANTASTIVARDASGNFSAGTISAALQSSTASGIQSSYQAAINTTTPGFSALYGIHFNGQTTNDYASGITWNGGSTTTQAQAGIYVQGSGAYGTNMYIATTDSYAVGSKTAISIDHTGLTNFVRARPTALGNVILDAGNYTSYVGNGTLTMNVSGNGLSGSQTFTANQSGNATYTVTSNATSVNTASTIVFRDASGNFNAGIVTATRGGYTLPDTGASAQWIYLGRWSGMTQAGAKLQIKIVAATGYNASIAQNCLTEIYFKTSNGSSFQAGTTGNFFADGQAWRTGPNATTPSTIRVVQTNTTTYDIYGNFAVNSGTNSFYTVSVANGSWTHSGTIVTPTGNSIDLPVYQILDSNNYNTYAPTLTGTGASGTWGINITGNAATATTAGNVNNGTLTLATSGTGISGSATFTANQAGNSTFTVTSNATDANTASTIVARNASGNFSAGTITASLSGNATTATTATNLAGGSAGTVPYQSAAGATAMLAAGTAGQYLRSNGAAAPSWATLPTIGNGTLTLVVSGNGLSGSATFTANQSGGSTFTVTSNATAANTASTIAYRDTNNGFAIGYLNNNTWYNYNDNDRNANSATYYPNASARAVRYFFANSSTTGTGGNYAGVLQFNPWDGTTASTGDASYQLAFGSTAVNGGGIPELNIRKGIDTTWNSWYTILHSGNYNSYSPTLSGAGANGTWGINVTGYAANVLNAVTFNNGGAGGASGSTFNGSSGLTVSYNTIGAPSTTGTNASGTWGISITGNAATATTASNVNNGTLTMNVSGTGLSGSQTFTANQSTNATFTVTSNATNANTASTIVARDASGNFSAGTITAALSGNATTATTATNLAGGSAGTVPYQSAAGTTVQLAAGASGQVLRSNGAAAPSWVNGTISGISLGSNLNTLTMNVSGTGLSGSTTYNGSAAATFTVTSNATNANTASTIVARDASGNFSAGTITATLSGNATTATTATNQSGGTVSATTGAFSGVVSLAAGSASAPAATRTGDTDTGLYFPAANTLAAAAGGSTVWNASSTFGFKNRIINGGMVIDQRNNGASVTQTVAQTYVTDRFAIFGSVTSKFTAQQSTTAPTGFINSLLITSSSAYTVGTSEFFQFRQTIEGLNVADLAWGTASAQTVTLSFWTRSSLTGTFGGAVGNNAGNRSYPFTYTISAANTWEYKTVTIAGDTTGTWLTNTSGGIWLYFGLGVGSTYSGTAGAWAAADYRSATGAVSVVGTSGATFYVTGVQLERGSVATSFDFRSYGNELILCQRYFAKTFDGLTYSTGSPLVNTITGTTTRIGIPNTLVVMRAIPTVVVYNWAGTTGNLTEFSSGTSKLVTGVTPASTIGGGYCDIASLAYAVWWSATYSAEL